MLKILAAICISLLALNLAVFAAKSAYNLQPHSTATTDQSHVAELERQVQIQREWIRQHEEAASGRFSYYSPDSLGELERGRPNGDRGLIRSVSGGLNGTPYAGFNGR